MPDWVNSKYVGGVGEVTLLTPIKKGLVPGELRTYEQRLHAELLSVQQRIEKGFPTPVARLPTIHFARWLLLRPAQYLYCDKDQLYCGGKDGVIFIGMTERHPTAKKSKSISIL